MKATLEYDLPDEQDEFEKGRQRRQVRLHHLEA
jgi:hypothetical protein